MYAVISEEATEDFENLALALDYAMVLGKFVTIKGNEMEIVGIFGADAVENGVCPNGLTYTWKKRRI